MKVQAVRIAPACGTGRLKTAEICTSIPSEPDLVLCRKAYSGTLRMTGLAGAQPAPPQKLKHPPEPEIVRGPPANPNIPQPNSKASLAYSSLEGLREKGLKPKNLKPRKDIKNKQAV